MVGCKARKCIKNTELNDTLKGYNDFKMCDKFITNLHQPQSTLMMLTAAFAKKDFILQAYEEAIKKKYRFYSYGDSMIII